MDACQTGAGVYAAACVRAVDRDLSCRVTNDRMKLMTTHRPDCAGKSLLELLWDQLMETMQELMEQMAQWVEYQEENDPMHFCEERENRVTTLWAVRGNAKGLAQAIAFIINPYAPDLDAVRAEAAERYANQ